MRVKTKNPAREVLKIQRREERKNFQHSFKTGDILVCSWGYEQTNIDFYQVKEIKGKQVLIQMLNQSRIYTGDMSGYTLPNKDDFDKTEPVLRKTVLLGNSIKITDYSHAYLWDGRKEHFTEYA